MRIIDTTDSKLIEQYEERKEQLIQDIIKKGSVNEDDFCLVRTTNYLPNNNELIPLCKIPFTTHPFNLPRRVISSILEKVYNINKFNEQEYEKLKREAEIGSPVSSQYRSTIHFTLNGLVSSHSKGNFDGQNFIILDRLNKHLGIDNIRSIRMEDTFIQGSCTLSNDAIILVNADRINDLILEYPNLQDYNVILFKGDEKLAVEILLTEMGIVPEIIETHSARYSERTPIHNSFFNSVENKYGISQEKHYYSKEYEDDDEKNYKLFYIYDTHFYQAFVNEFKLNQQIISILLQDNNEAERLLEKLINQVGLDKYLAFVISYNEQIKSAIKNGTFPDNDTILKDGKIIIKDTIKNKKTI